MSIRPGQLYNEQMREAGEIAEHLPGEYISSFVSAGPIPFGQAVARGATPEKAKIISAGTDEFLGVAGLSFEASDYDNRKYSQDDPCGVVRIGIVVVCVEEDVQPGDKVRVRHTAVAGKAAGVFCKTAETGKTALIKHAEWGSTTEDGRAILWVNGPCELVAD